MRRTTPAAVREAALGLFATRGYQQTTMSDIADALGIRAPSLYNHVSSKQELLHHVMVGTMDALIATHHVAVEGRSDRAAALRAATEAHVRYHAEHRAEAFVGNREINSLDPAGRGELLALRDTYERGFRNIIRAGVRSGEFEVRSVRLASYAILDMGIGVSTWFRPDGAHSAGQVARQYGELALRMVGVRDAV